LLARLRRYAFPLAVTSGVLGLIGCGASPGAPLRLPAASTIAQQASGSSRLVVILMENEELGSIIGSRDAPYINSLARRYARASDYHAVTHPSLPNYLALTGGDTFGIDSDCTDCAVRAPGLADQLSSAGIGWKAYMEDMPRPCYPGASYRGYAKKHDPFLYYASVSANRSRCAHVVPFGDLAGALRAGGMPTFTWITPNLCDDMHDCSVATGDRFLRRLVPALLAGLGPHGLLVLVWDEGSTNSGCCGRAAGGRVALVLAGPDVRRGVYSQPADHYSLLRLFEDVLGVPRLRNAGCPCTPSLNGMLKRLPRLRAR
jgi:phosphatidylinositol-3-phosphatase